MVQQGPAVFVADTLGLDFLNSIATPVDTVVDWIGDGEGLLAWLDQAGLVPAEVLAGLREQALPGELDAVAAQARALREEFRAFVRPRMGRPLGPEDLPALAPLNRLLARDEGFLQVTAVPGGEPRLRTAARRHWRSPESLLLPLAEALAASVVEEDFSSVKACEGPACTLLFADRTRGHVRRWCSMATCGNRAKQAAHRTRSRRRRAGDAPA